MNKIILIFMIILLFTLPTSAYTTSQHISVAVILSDYTQTNTQAFLVGFTSHAALDSVRPQMYRYDLFRPQGNYDLMVLETSISLWQIWKYRHNKKVLYSIAGSLAPDVIETIFVLRDRQRWYEGNHVFPWHSNITNDRMTKQQTVAVSLVLFSFEF